MPSIDGYRKHGDDNAASFTLKSNGTKREAGYAVLAGLAGQRFGHVKLVQMGGQRMFLVYFKVSCFSKQLLA